MAKSCPCEWEDFTKWIIPHVSSPKDEFKRPPAALIESYVRRIAYDFAKQTGVLRKTIYLDVFCGVCDYPVSCLDSEDIISYKVISLNGCELTDDDYYIEDDILYLNYAPQCDEQQALSIQYAYAPCLESNCEVPIDFCTRYREAIIYGTLAELFCMPHMDWNSSKAAQKYEDRYRKYISKGKIDIRKRKSSKRKTIYDMTTRFIR